MYSAKEGRIEVSVLKATPSGPSAFRGTFSGTLRSFDEDAAAITVTDGEFEVEGADYFVPEKN